ncbi:hypothetical protein IW262DRAFT_1443858 [Armillaria fumosa]|nr:hypothetical protein IW262DRAFT_1443858 [Armillaria fumosa]
MDNAELTYIVNHVFMPPVLPQADDRDLSHDAALCHAVLDCAHRYRSHLLNDAPKLRNWDVIIKMLQNFEATLSDTLGSAEVYRQLSSMVVGDTLVFHINGQNACVVFRKRAEEVIYEAFEVMFPNEKVMGAIGKLISSFPGPAIAVPSETFDVPAFCQELASFLVEMHNDHLEEASPTSRKAGHNVIEEREPPHPRFITQLLTGILYGQGGHAADIKRFSKRINDDVRWLNAKLPWRRSPIWLVLRVALQSSLFEGIDHLDYKMFITYFLASVLDKARAKGWRSDMLDVMKKKMCRRLAKLGSSVPLYLQERVHAIGEEVNDLIEERGRHIEIQQQRSTEWNPSKLDFVADTIITLPNSSSYIKSILQCTSSPQPVSPFSLSHIPRLKDDRDFSLFTKDRLSLAFNKDKFIALADFEYCVENHLDGWLSCALYQSTTSGILSVCIFEYMTAAEAAYASNAEDQSIMLLTIIALWVALDKAAVAQHPLLHDYSPEVPVNLLEPLLLRHAKPLNCIISITQYIRNRHSSAIWNNLSLFDETASHSSFAVHYFNSSTELQQLKQRIELDAASERAEKVTELQKANDHYHALKREAESLEHEYTQRWQHWGYETVHITALCKKCKLEKQYTSMTIAMAKMVHWRVATYTILHDLFSSASPPMKLSLYISLQKYSFLQAHYKNPKIPTTEAQVCLCSGLTYQLYDSKCDIWISNPFKKSDMIANQSDCSTTFTGLRSGEKLQWLNIIRELRARMLTFNHEASACQVDWHIDLSLLKELWELLLNVKGNWLEGVTLRSIIFISVYDIMRKARIVVFLWVQMLVTKLQMTTNESDMQDLQCHIFELASTVQATYDVESEHISALLQSDQDIKILVESTIIIHDNTPIRREFISLEMQRLLCRSERLSHFIEPYIQNMQWNRAFQQGINLAVTSIWPAYRATHWTMLHSPNHRWINTLTAVDVDQQSQPVHLNLLTGLLLINGKPLGRLPQDITSHPTYVRIFGIKILDIVPSDRPGIEYATRLPISGWQVYLGLRNDALIVQTKKDNVLLELIPHTIFSHDLPHLFVEEYTHWINLNSLSTEIEIRPLISLWKPSSHNWRMIFNAPKQIMSIGEQKMVDIHSQTFKMISGCLQNFEQCHYIHIIYNASNATVLSVDLPRFQISFFLNENTELECQNLPNMLIDRNQSAGTLLGLENRLVLCSKYKLRQVAQYQHVLIPFGKVYIQQKGDHVQIVVQTDSIRFVKFYDYIIDVDIGRLVSNSNLTSNLYQIFLHALSSHPFSDPLTGRTGTEEAIQLLQSAVCYSFQDISKIDLELLHKIAAFTPSPTCMQSVQWCHSYCSFQSQHHAFYKLVQEIINYARLLQVFSKKDYDIIYHSRDQEQDDTRIAANTSQIVRTESFSTISSPSFIEKPSIWKNIGPGNKNFSLSYNRSWLSSEHLQKNWLSFLHLNCDASLRMTPRKWQSLFSMSAMSYNDDTIRAIIPSLLALTVYSWQHISENLSLSWSFDLSIGDAPKESYLVSMISNACVSLNDSPVASMVQNDWESYYSFLQWQQAAYNSLDNEQAPEVLHSLLALWSLEIEPTRIDTLSQFSSIVLQYFQHCFHNTRLLYVTGIIQNAIANMPAQSLQTTSELLASHYISAPHESEVTNIFLPNKYDLSNSLWSASSLTDSDTTSSESDTEQLTVLISEFSNSSNKLKRLYGEKLRKSQQHLVSMALPSNNSLSLIPVSINKIEEYRDTCQIALTHMLAQITTSLKASNTCELALQLGGFWPCINTHSILSQFTHDIIGAEWKATIKKFALLFMQYQRAERLLLSVVSGNAIEFHKEMSNNEVTAIYPEWLLLQVDNNFISRPVQTSVAHEIISPLSNRNSVLQLNMGEGKSSVIVPMTAIITANGQSVARVVVLKSLARQMFQLLVQCISRLVNRHVFYMPFSRCLTIGSKEIKTIWNLYRQCMAVGGVLVIQPEHILSFKLMCIDRLLDNSRSDKIDQGSEAAQLLELQKWLDVHVRDILDESDEILHVRYQLIYTMGTQCSLEGHPDCWMITQQIFRLVADIISSVKLKAPHSVEVCHSKKKDGSFPFICIYSTDDKAGIALVDSVCTQILAGKLENYPIFTRLSDSLHKQVQQFISNLTVEPDTVRSVHDLYFGTDTWNLLLLLRGLFGYGILVYVLKARRYRVDYGLDLSRTLLAVPYHAKDTPSIAAEFGHPDVAIALTCLSYYYAGLTDKQVDICFDLLFKEDDPSIEYSSWIKNNELIPSELQHISGVNMKDVEQHSQCLRPFFCCNHAVVDFFLSHVVFPKHAKQFPQKISTSGWDLAATRSKYTTGFSGTNDNHHLLPLSIQQNDPVEQQGTNAKVLDYLLRSENNFYLCTGSNQTTEAFLETLVNQHPKIHVLLDVGAQMLDLHNKELAKLWLSLALASAAIYFNDTDEMMVLDCHGIAQPLILSPFKYQLDKCVIYLDEAHTRGTDLKLPIGFRAAVTLGANVTKDRLVQGAMRMRQLGQGQSVMFFAPQEIDLQIRKAAGKSESAKVEAVDILRWSMLETCNEITHHVPQWAQQGYDYQQRNRAWEACVSSNGSPAVLNPWLQPEGHFLQELYGLSDGPTPDSAIWQVSELRERCEMLGVSSVSGTNMNEEQEREVSHEIERERQVERPPKVLPAAHSLHDDVCLFICTGTIKAKSTAFKPLFHVFNEISSAFSPSENVWACNLLCTQDFAVTVKTSSYHQNTSDYLRSINWIVSAQHNEHMILVLLPEIRISSKVHLHIYSPKVSVSTKHFDDLQFYCIPKPGTQINNALLITQLNIFAGQLYLQDYKEYQQLCSFLGLYQQQRFTDENVSPEHRSEGDISPFKTSPVPFLKALLGSRRKGHPYLATHVGKMLHGYVLTSESFD